jgi:DNA-binding NtrC family response regulator
VSLGKLVAIVDDEQDITALFHDALASINGIIVCAFTDPILALEHFQKNKDGYALVISDFKMPGLNGLELLGKMKGMNKYARTILMTAFETDDKLFRHYTNKKIIDTRIQKPIRIYDLLKEVHTQLHYYEMQKIYPIQ